MSIVQELARQAGFSECFVLPPDKFQHYERLRKDGVLSSSGQNLCIDPRSDYPWANALLLLLYAYHPYPKQSGVSGNYPASNAAYHAGHALLTLLMQSGVRAETVYVPVRELALRSGVGISCRNGLTAFDGYGTRVAVQTLAVCLPDGECAATSPQKGASRTCPGCGRCEAVCPTHAISSDGYVFTKCARAYMGKEPMPNWAMDAMTSLLGCELCQFACPLNAGIAPLSEVPEAFALERILGGEIKPVLALVGKNLNAGGRILCHAAVMAGKAGRRDLLPEITALLDDPREAVKAAANYAIFLLQDASLHDTMNHNE